MSSLLAEYERLIQRREALRTEGNELMARLDKGEITAQEWRKSLMARTQEASQISEKLRIMTSRLRFLGYNGLLA
jgi:cell division septum initiation protein DivIVA